LKLKRGLKVPKVFRVLKILKVENPVLYLQLLGLPAASSSNLNI